MKLRTGFAALFLAASSLPALAAATVEEAQRLTEVFQSYLSGTPGVVTVAPGGDSYDAKIDFAPLLAKVAQPGFSANVTPLAMTLTPQGDGKWKVDQDQPLSFALKVEGQVDMKGSIGSLKGTGLFDEALGAFTTSTTDYTQFAFDQTVIEQGRATRVTYTIGSLHSDSQMAAAASGADGTVKTKFADFKETMSIPAAPDGSSPALDLTITARDGAQDVAIKGLQSKAVLGLAAWLVAHPSADQMKLGQAELKDRLRAALPIFTAIDGTTSVNEVGINTMVGRFGMAKADVKVTLNGIVDEGYLREGFTISGLTMPDGIVPPWAGGLVPENFTIDFDIADFNLAAAARLVIDNFDLTRQPPLKPEIEQQIVQALLPKGAVKIGLQPSAIMAKVFALKAEGAMTAGPVSVPAGQAKVGLKGLDEVMAALNAAPPEMGLQQMSPMLILAKGLGKPEPDGSLSWKIEMTPQGSVLVNGTDLSKMGGGQ